MTHPSDIAGLSERLREMPSSLNDACRKMDEAATALDSLTARVKELEAERDKANARAESQWAGWIKADCARRAAEQQRDEAYERAAKVAECDISSSHYGIAARVRIARNIRRLASGPEGGSVKMEGK